MDLTSEASVYIASVRKQTAEENVWAYGDALDVYKNVREYNSNFM